MYPLLLKSPIKDYLWGGTKLKTDFGFETEKDIAAEAWMLSCHKDGMNVVLNGEHKGKTINEVLELWGKSALGKDAEKFSYFPILIKLIDAKQKLSVQVHPDDDYALSVEGEYGKTEMWYVVDCEDDAELIYGFQKDISKEEFEKRIKDNTLLEACNSVPVSKGDVFFIEAGTLHAIGEGILIAEIQQNSDLTYRVYDYERRDAQGNLRQLHTDKAVKVVRHFDDDEVDAIRYSEADKIGVGECLASCKYFNVNRVSLNGNSEKLNTNGVFHSLLCVEGEGEIVCQGESYSFSKGDSYYLPEALGEYMLRGNATVLVSRV